MGISAKELASLINVSEATISMVINHKSGISEATIDKVIEGARKYDYDLSKYYMYSTELQTICFLTYKKNGEVVTDSPFFAEMTEGISSVCKARNISLSLEYIYADQPIAEQIKVIEDKKYSGIIVLATEMNHEDFIPFTSVTTPMVMLDSYSDLVSLDYVLINNLQGAYLATKHLAENGFKEIGYLKSTVRIPNFKERAEGYHRALRHNKIKANDDLIIDLTPSLEGAYNDMKKYLAKKPKLAKAYFADNDWIAAGAMRALLEAGYKIPEDISLIGFDDVPICGFLSTPLTTMHVYKFELGALAVEQLINKMNSVSKVPFRYELLPTLTLRNSVKEK